MSSVIRPDQEAWEYRHRCFEPETAFGHGSACSEQDPEFIRWMIDTLEDLENRSDEGWRMVRAKIESDEWGRLWLDVLVKRPRSETTTLPHAA